MARTRSFDETKALAAMGDVKENLLTELRHKLQGGASQIPREPSSTPANTAEPVDTNRGQTPSISAFTRDLSQTVRDGQTDSVVGRNREIMSVMEILARKGKHNVILAGEAGVGKTKIVEGLAALETHRDRVGRTAGRGAAGGAEANAGVALERRREAIVRRRESTGRDDVQRFRRRFGVDFRRLAGRQEQDGENL